jgi:hypothetical protein
MIARCFWTLALLGLAVIAFWGDALGMGHVVNPIGLLFVAIAALVWFKWNSVASAFRAAQGGSNLPIVRLGYDAIKGAGFKTPRDGIPGERPSGGG